MCQLRDGTPTVARMTTRPSMIRQRFSRRVRRYPVSFGRRTLHRSAHPPRAPITNPDNTRANQRARSPATRHSYSPSTLLHAPVHRSDPSARGDLRARHADDSAAFAELSAPSSIRGCPMSTRPGPKRGLASSLRVHARSTRAQGSCDARAVRATTRTAPSCVRAGLSYRACSRWQPRSFPGLDGGRAAVTRVDRVQSPGTPSSSSSLLW